ncbi:MAG TPA: pyridoxal phosphate-dependent aminotransferase [Polyangiaceae bacterium]|nr:pyridoxal phosphate-dependent aminotransferase [Polyangiaceae bacterium]
MARFPKNDIISLIGEAPRYELAASLGPDLRLAELLAPSGESSLGDMPLAYGTAAGDPRLRRAIAELHGVHADDVVITVGAMHAIFLVAFVLCDRGDEAVTTSLSFPPARTALDVVGADVRALPVSFEQGYQPDAAALCGLLSPKTKLVSLTSPQNPSGVAIDRKTIEAVLSTMESRCPEAYLLVDETYREAVYGGDPVAATMAAASPRIISVASLSKCHGAPGLRIGWAIARDPALREQLVLGKFNTVASCSPVDEALALAVFRQRDRIFAERRQHLSEGLARVEDWVRAHHDVVDWVRPTAGALCCVRLKPSVFDDPAVGVFYDALAREGVRVAKGTWFGGEARVFRLGFGLLPMSTLDQALEGLSAAVFRARTGAEVLSPA